LAVVLAPFPPGLFDAFSSVERSVPLADLTVMQARKPALVVKSVSRFAGLASDEEPDGNEAIPMAEPPGPRVARSRKEAVDEQEEDGGVAEGEAEAEAGGRTATSEEGIACQEGGSRGVNQTARISTSKKACLCMVSERGRLYPDSLETLLRTTARIDGCSWQV
jgi:hypothetical protein